MFKKISMFTVLIAVLLVAIPLQAQDDENKISAGVKAGWFFFNDEDLSDYLENNWTIAGEVKMWFAGGLGIGAEVQYLTKTKDAVEIDSVNIDFEYSHIPINVDLFYRIPTADGMFYVGGGGSFVFADMTLSTDDFITPIEVSADDTVFGFNGVAGFQYGNFFVEGQWLWAEANFEFDDVDVDGEVQLGGPSIWVGVRF